MRPSADVWVVYGDGSVGYSLAEFDTFVRHGIGVIALVGNDAGWTQIAREQVEVLHDDVGTVLARTDYQRAAEGSAARGLLPRRRRSDRTPCSARRATRALRPPRATQRPHRKHRLPQGLDLDVRARGWS